MSYGLLLFDLDGTLVDSLPDIAGALNHALVQTGLAPLPLPVVRGLIGEGVVRLAEKALAAQETPPRGVDPAALARQIVAHYEAHPSVSTRLFDGVASTVAALRISGKRLAVLTNKPGGVARALLVALGVADAFDAVIGDGDGYERKPDPDAARSLCARFGVPAGRTLMVGDGLPDLEVARAVPCAVAAVAWGYTDRPRLAAERPDHLVDKPAELLALV